MSVRNLQHLFAPRSVALIGASARPGSMGATLLANLQGGGFKGKLFAVNPKYRPARGARPGRHLHAGGHRAATGAPAG
jgi:acetyltransferase